MSLPRRVAAALLAAALSLGGAAAAVSPPATPSVPLGGTHTCDYPRAAVQVRRAGKVLIRYDVGPDGAIVNVRLLKSSGSDVLDRAALYCVSTNWRNAAATRNGVAVASPDHRVVIEFTLDSRPATVGGGGGMARPSLPILILAGLALLALIVLLSRWSASRRTCPACHAANRSALAAPRYCSRCGVKFAAT